jgi:hypothetical protein
LYGKNRFGEPENFTEFEDDGSMRMAGEATVYKDLNVSTAGLTPSGAAAPDLINFVNGNLQIYAFDGGVTTERLYGSIEINHDYKEGSNVEVHIHWAPTTAAAGNVKWQLYISWANNGEDFKAPALHTVTAPAAGAWLSTYSSIAVLSGVGKTINSQFVFQIFRDPTDGADTYGADAALITVGIHYQCDTVGSRSPATKD